MMKYKKLSISILLIFIFFIITANFILWLFESSFVFKPAKYPVGNWHPAGLQPIDAWLNTADGTRIHGWYFPHPHPKGIILYLHGNVGNVTTRYSELVQLHDKLSASIMSVDYRGFGKSAGYPDEKGILQDAEAARIWLANKEHVMPDQVILLGRSMGGGVAVDLAARFKIKSLILIGTFMSLPDTVNYHYPILAAHWVMHNKFDSIHKISAYQGPLLDIHGEADEVIPLQHGKILFATAKGSKRFIPVSNGRHFDAISDDVYAEIDRFIRF